ncbi:glycine/D-amino acid oxidase-like deaminating enzyme [Pseudomonas sp. SJZ103]|uniref:NAD(P)/FAD-dependent oxidoreductase n=1 Tax=unclassified Pseudomonas TaxID=196821 RepID=UPI00119E6334|nr:MULTISPECIES: FAD-binding oxidoreductase [unclassified Pseudomonas]MBB6287449.1 glycine/D-amino acid oxidase-like deaminating enzyme [Pseudomonas sp. SJZ073]MBB6310624.1 glycine/D-amino acid oxidase-like deaminating enzyme [Pseudomonas sp. JAI120]NJJ56870.1 FAD-binding oxidoreductase [Pseudomonas sp. B14(2022)]TWC63508.1 glycine/D-amino acid oxidase-like deaminating enzyme [Pseudomonas sp. SJZ103]TWC80553.1 glycine/D-amino acid oxidase-like deaminating enzyme [Pseudomonas sp. SJZ094]
MAPTIAPVNTSTEFPSTTAVVIIGGGIIGLTAALTLAERNIPVVVLEKGRIAGEQSSRNLGWVRKTSRHAHDIPLALAADRLWAQMPERIGADVGYRQEGIMFVARNEAQMAMHDSWLKSVEHLSLDSRLLSNREIAQKVPGGAGEWAGGIYTPSDARAEPTLASSAIAKAAMALGVVIIEQCAVRTLQMSAGKVSGVVTEKGEIRCDQVLLAGGMWSRRFLGNLGVSLPTLALTCSVLRTHPMLGPTEIAVGAPDFSFRKHKDGGFIITQRGKLDAFLTLDHLLLAKQYMPQFRAQRSVLNVSLGKYFFNDLALSRRWSADSVSPFERVRVQDPAANPRLNNDAMNNLKAAWPVFEQARIAQAWAGTIDVTPDSNPVIGPVAQIPGLTVATGFSGHGFGTSPAAGHLAADMVSGHTPIIDPSPYRFDRF